MTGHRIRYDIIGTAARPVYTAVCSCGERRQSTSRARLSAWAPEHVVRAYERTLTPTR